MEVLAGEAAEVGVFDHREGAVVAEETLEDEALAGVVETLVLQQAWSK